MAGRLEIGGGDVNVGLAYLAERRNRLLDSLRQQQQMSSEREAAQRNALERQRLGLSSQAQTNDLLRDRARMQESARQFDLTRGDRNSENEWDRGFKTKAYGDSRGDTLKRLALDETQVNETLRRNQALEGDRDLDRKYKEDALKSSQMNRELAGVESKYKTPRAQLLEMMQKFPANADQYKLELQKLEAGEAAERSAIYEKHTGTGGTPNIPGISNAADLVQAGRNAQEAEKKRSEHIKRVTAQMAAEAATLEQQIPMVAQSGQDPTPLISRANQLRALAQQGLPESDVLDPKSLEGKQMAEDTLRATAAERQRRQVSLEADRKKVDKETSVTSEVKDAVKADPGAYEKFVEKKAEEKGWGEEEKALALTLHPSTRFVEETKRDIANGLGTVEEAVARIEQAKARGDKDLKGVNIPFVIDKLRAIDRERKKTEGEARDAKNRAALLAGAETGAARAASDAAFANADKRSVLNTLGRGVVGSVAMAPLTAISPTMGASQMWDYISPPKTEAEIRQAEILRLQNEEKNRAARVSEQSRGKALQAMVGGRY